MKRRPVGEGGAPDDAASITAIVTSLSAWRERRAWARAILALHGQGLPAAAPCDVAAWLRARGLDADWYYRGPCSCGREGCWVLAADGDRVHGEVHATVTGLAPTGTGAS